MPVAPPAQYGIDCAIARRGNTRNSGHGYCPKGQYAALCAYCAGWRNRTRVALLPDGAIRATRGTAIAQKGNTPRLARLLLAAIRRSLRLLRRLAQYGFGCAIAQRGNTRNSGHGYCPKGQYAAPAFYTREPYSGFASRAFAFSEAISMINSTSF